MHTRFARLVLLAVTAVSAAQGQSALRIRVTLTDSTQAATPVPRHALLISDNPPTREPRRVVTGPDGIAAVSLPPGAYVVESDRPVAFGGRAYQWTQTVDLIAGRDATLDLTVENAQVVPLTDVPATSPRETARSAESELLTTWQPSIVSVWTPTARATGFLVDRRGLIATDGGAVGTASLVAVQMSPSVKVAGRVLHTERSRDVAIIWVDPGLIANGSPLSLPCPPAPTPSLDDGQLIMTIAEPHQRDTQLIDGEVTALQPRVVETDLGLPFGGAGGPVFNERGALVGLTSRMAGDDLRRRDVAVVRAIFLCEALAAAMSSLTADTSPEPTRLPIEPTRAYPPEALEDARGTSADPPLLTSTDFDVAFLTPPMVSRARQRTDRTGGRRARSDEAEARLGALTEFGAWSEYFASDPPVLIVRVTPKLVEGFWKRLGREAARTQGAVLPPFKDFKTSFSRLRASCDGAEVMPIHPFVLDHRVSDSRVIREGLYVFDPDAFGPHCESVTLSLFSEAQPERAQTVTVNRAVIDRTWQDFAAWRAARR